MNEIREYCLPGARQVSQESLVCWAKYSVAILCYYTFENLNLGSFVYFLYFAGISKKWYGNAVFAQIDFSFNTELTQVC